MDTTTDPGLYAQMAKPAQRGGEDEEPPDPVTVLTATIETVDNDRPLGAVGSRSGLPLP